MLPDFPKFKKMLSAQQTAFFHHLIKQQLDPFFRNIPNTTIYEGGKTQFNYPGETVYETELDKFESEATLNVDELKKNPNIFYEHLQKMAHDFAEQQTHMVIRSISNVTEAVGNVVTGEMTFESILEMYEKVEIPFDEKGNPLIPALVAGADMIKKFESILLSMETHEEWKVRLKILIDKKRQIWYDRENNRKLVG